MKRIVASVGLVALGTSGLQAGTDAAPSGSSNESGKPWSASATLRGFYDDNINSYSTAGRAFVNSYGYHNSSFGLEVSPALNFNWGWEQTTVSLGYVYSFKEYQHRAFLDNHNYDQTHSFNAALDHAFNESFQLAVRDSLVVGQEPDFLRPVNSAESTFSRINGDNIRNAGSATLTGQLTPLFGMSVGYANSFYDYADKNIGIDPNTGNFAYASNAGNLNRIEHNINLATRWQLQPETVGLVGYQFTIADYTGDQQITPGAAGGGVGPVLFSKDRNARSHYGYAGLDHTFSPNLSGSVRIGGRFTDHYNSPDSSTEVAPYAQLSLRYLYAPESYVEIGFTHDRAATDLIGVETPSGQITMDSDSSTVYGSVSHKIMSNLYGSLMASFQDSSYNFGQYDGSSEQFYSVGASVEYRFNRYVSTQVGYNYDNLKSDLGRSFDRNRVYIGVTASY